MRLRGEPWLRRVVRRAARQPRALAAGAALAVTLSAGSAYLTARSTLPATDVTIVVEPADPALPPTEVALARAVRGRHTLRVPAGVCRIAVRQQGVRREFYREGRAGESIVLQPAASAADSKTTPFAAPVAADVAGFLGGQQARELASAAVAAFNAVFNDLPPEPHCVLYYWIDDVKYVVYNYLLTASTCGATCPPPGGTYHIVVSTKVA